MAESQSLHGRQKLRELVVEASRSLATLDAARLEELALSCQALNRDLPQVGTEVRAELVRQAREAQKDMAVFARVLEVTRANLNVMSRLRSLREDHLEYGEQLKQGWQPAEKRYGDH